jgi:WD40 repeat protein
MKMQFSSSTNRFRLRSISLAVEIIMRISGYFQRTLSASVFVFTFLAGCAPPAGGASTPPMADLPAAPQATLPDAPVPSLLAAWKMGVIHDVVWSLDSRAIAINYRLENESEYFVRAFSVEPPASLWTAGDSLAWGLIFSPDGRFIVEPNTNAPIFYWRSVEHGGVVRRRDFMDASKVKPGDCNGGGQILAYISGGNTALMANYNNLLGPRTNNIVVVSQLDLETGECNILFDYQGSFDLFDLNSGGTLLAYGGEGEDDSVVIRDLEKQVEVCRAPSAEFGRFIPGGNTLALVREQKIDFIDAATCVEMRHLNVVPLPDYENYMAFSPDGKQLALARESIQIMNATTGELMKKIPFPQDAIPISNKLVLSGISFSPDGRYLLIAYDTLLLNTADDGEIQIWQMEP